MERDIKLDARDREGRRPIHLAAVKGRLDNVKLLVEEAGVDPALTDNEVNQLPVCAPCIAHPGG